MKRFNIVRAKSRTYLKNIIVFMVTSPCASLGRRIFFFSLFLLAVLLYPNPYTLTPAIAAICTTSGTQIVQNGLVTSPILGQNLVTNSGVCIIDPKAVFTPALIPNYENLKSLYYTKPKTTTSITKHPALSGDQTNSEIPITTGKDHIYYISGNLTINGNISGNQTGVIFVDGNLNINSNINSSSANAGIMFVVKGNVNITSTVTNVDALIISSGTICTAYNGSSCPASDITAPKLTINGSLISIYKDNVQPDTCSIAPSTSGCPAIKFRRTLADNTNTTDPSEKINHEVKYLVILRHLFSETFQRWWESDASDPLSPKEPSSIAVITTTTSTSTTLPSTGTYKPTITTDDTYTTYTFTKDGTFIPAQNMNVDVLVVAGGGGGGGSVAGGAGPGGGGAGGFKEVIGKAVEAKTYTVTVGRGGSGTNIISNTNASNGGNSSFDSLVTATGGGHGGAGGIAGSGGSGGGATYGFDGGAGTPGQGHSGGGAANGNGGGGGGGAGGTGSSGGLTWQGSGGIRLRSSITGSSYAKGGVGGFYKGYIESEPGYNGANGAAYTGDGGGGSTTNSQAGANGGNGGSGIVVVRYLGNPPPALPATAITTASALLPTAYRAFVTSTDYNGNLGGISGADAKCQASADAVSLKGVWKAWISNSTTLVNDRFYHSPIPYELIDGTQIAGSWMDLVDGSLGRPINLGEDENIPTDPYNYVWTGTSFNGSKMVSTGGCSDWSLNSGGGANIGIFDQTGPGWTYAGYDGNGCASKNYLYCFEQPACNPGITINGCFKDPENPLANWSCSGDGTNAGSCIKDSETKNSADYSAKVAYTGSGGWGWQLSQSGISAVSGDSFCLSAMVLQDIGNVESRIAIQESAFPWRESYITTPSNPTATRISAFVWKAADNPSWNLVRGTVTVGDGWTTPIQVYGRTVLGTAWFDDISLTKGACL